MTTEVDSKGPALALQKPRLVLMGEFSSGKSTLSNILLGGATLPTQVTATRLPPVHVSHGAPGAHAITRDGQRIAVDLTDLAHLTPDSIRALHVTMIADTLELCDLVDMPGISDPNMAADTWEGVLRPGDHVIWCTHATQAWRQSEAAMWDRMRRTTGVAAGEAIGAGILLVTQFDKLRNARDRSRVLNRIAAETAGKFTATYPVSLLDALAAGDDLDAWIASGAHAFMEHLVEILLSPDVAPAVVAAPAPAVVAALGALTAVSRENVFEIPHQAASRITPRRVRIKAEAKAVPRPVAVTGWVGAMEPGVL